MNWLYSAHLDIAGDHVSYREILGNLFGLASALAGMRRLVWAWPVGIVGNALLFSVFMWTSLGATEHGPLLGQAGRQVFFVIMSIYGWRRWATRKRSVAASTAVTPRWATRKERAAYLAIGAFGVAACFVIFRAIGAGFHVPGWWYYLADAWIFVGSIVATFAMARGWVDFWLCWIAVDCVGVPELMHLDHYPTAAMYAIYAGFVVWGFVVWMRLAQREVSAVDVVAVPEVAR